MCSVAGSPTNKETLKMLEMMKHRSPDGYHSVNGIGMGLLSITGDSPFPFVYGDDILTFNGEIYNYKDFINEFELTTDSDTEVLYHLYKRYGIDCLNKLNGMFAFAIKSGDTIFLARDIAGEKPLYYSLRGGQLRFASEAKALGFKCEEFPPAHYGIFKKGDLQLVRYWTPKKRVIDMEKAEDELTDLIEDSVRLRTDTKRPYALFYSGGVDSTLLRQFSKPQELLTYTDGDYKEEFLQSLSKIVWHLDYPVKSFSAFGLWKLSQQAREQGYRIILSGEGADELFGGYIRYLPDALGSQALNRYPHYEQYFPHHRDINELGWEDFNGNMQELLRMGDRMAGAWGVENRCPFLDKRIIEFAFSLPPESKIDGFTTKKILRNVLSRLQPTYQH